MAEWSIAAVLKTVELRGSGGSNPSLSAKERSKKMSMIRHLFFVLRHYVGKFICTHSGGKQKLVDLSTFAE